MSVRIYISDEQRKQRKFLTYRIVQVSIEFEHRQNYFVPNLSALILKCIDVTKVSFMRLVNTVVIPGKKQLAYMIRLHDGLE